MRKEIRDKVRESRFSLHDAKIIGMQKQGEDLLLETDYGFVDILRNKMVEGDILIKGVSFEDSYVYIMEYKNVLCGNVGSFTGEKMTLETFIGQFQNEFASFDIINEYEGYHSFYMNGFLSRSHMVLEASIDIFYRGDFIYQIRD